MIEHLLSWAAAMLGTVVLSLSVSSYTDSGGSPPFQGLTYSGARTRPGVAACGPALYLRTLYVPGTPERFYTCLDRGSAVTDGHLDLWMASDGDALAWGRQELMALVLPVRAPQVMAVHPCRGRECER